MRKKVLKRGDDRMKEKGRKRVAVWVTAAQHATMLAFAKSNGMALAEFMRRIADNVSRGRDPMNPWA